MRVNPSSVSIKLLKYCYKLYTNQNKNMVDQSVEIGVLIKGREAVGEINREQSTLQVLCADQLLCFDHFVNTCILYQCIAV